MYRLLLLVMCFAFFSTCAFAEDAAAPFQNWWCQPVEQDIFFCTRFALKTEPAQAVSIILRTNGEHAGLRQRETAYLQRHSLEKNKLTYALPGTPEDKSTWFTVESADSATKMLNGGAWMAYARLPYLDAPIAGAMEHLPAQAAVYFSGTLLAEDGSPLFLHNPGTRTVTPLSKALVSLLGSQPCAVRAYKENWKEDGAKAGSTIVVAVPGGGNYGLKLNADNSELSVTAASSGDDKPVWTIRPAKGQKGL